MLVREFCAENMEHVPDAVAAGAMRIELCDNLAVGGTTPSYGVIRAAVAHAREHGVAVMCMVRPRGGDFEYTAAEAAMMRDDLLLAKRLGVSGAVFGCLRDGRLDRDLTAELVRLAHEPSSEAPSGIAVTFHMAFDVLTPDDQLAAIDWLVEQGVERILAHGGPAGTPIADSIEHLRRLVEHAAGHITILPGGGITWENAEAVAQELGVPEVHGTKIVKLAGASAS